MVQLGAVAALALVGVSLTLATSGILNLGKPATSLPPAYFPLSGFHHVTTSVGTTGHPELLFIGSLYFGDVYSAMERWPLVKALEQFGSLSGVNAIDTRCTPGRIVGCSFPTFNLSRAVYRSRYLSFVHRDLLNTNGKPFQGLSSAQLALYNRYARITPSHLKGDRYGELNTVLESTLVHSANRGLPLVAIGRYVQTSTQDMTQGTFEVYSIPPPTLAMANIPPTVLPFPTVQAALVQGKSLSSDGLADGVNAEANVITALICHADGDKPASVCRRSAIQQILRHVK